MPLYDKTGQVNLYNKWRDWDPEDQGGKCEYFRNILNNDYFENLLGVFDEYLQSEIYYSLGTKLRKN